MATKLMSAAPFGTALGATAALVPAAQTRFLAVDGGRIAYDDTGGSGPLVLALPGMGDLRSEYRLLRPALQRAGYRVVTMDVRGFGETSARWKDYSAHAVGRDALAVINHLNAGAAVILGNSFAAGSALWAAHDAPERVSGAVLDHLLGQLVSQCQTRGPRPDQRGFVKESARARPHGRAQGDDQPVQSGYRSHRSEDSGVDPHRHGYPRSRFPGPCGRSAPAC